MEPLVIVVWIAIPLIIVGVLVGAVVAERKRRQALEQAAGELGLAFELRLSDFDQGIFNQYQLAQQGRGRAASNAIVADSGDLRLVIFDYKYTTGGGKSQTTHRQSVVLVTSPSLRLPSFSLAPENFFHRFAEMLGFPDIDFDDDPEFSRRFLLKGPDEAAIRTLFDARRRAAFLKLPPVHVEGSGAGFIVYHPRKRRQVAQLRSLMEDGFAMFRLLSE